MGVWACKVVGEALRRPNQIRRATWLLCRRDVLRRCACRAVIECEPYFRPVGLRKMQRFANMLMRRIARCAAVRRPSWQNTFCLAREPVALANPVRTFGSLAPPNANADTPTHFFCGAGTIGATKPTLMPATNKSAARYARQSVTTGLIAGSDLVIVLISGVIKKYK